MTHLFPVFLNMQERNCLVVGGGQVAERKVLNLLEYKANITVVSPEVTDNLKQLITRHSIVWYNREFIPDDLENMSLVFVATDTGSVNQEVASLCREKGILINAVDDPPNCDLYIPSILKRGSLTVAISTEGKSPAYAARLRRELEHIITEDHGKLVDILGEQRDRVKETVDDIEVRRAIFQAMANSDLLELIQMGAEDKIRERIEQCMSLWQV